MNKPINWRMAIFRFVAIFFWISVGHTAGFVSGLVLIIVASIFMTMFQTEVAEEAVREERARAGTV